MLSFGLFFEGREISDSYYIRRSTEIVIERRTIRQRLADWIRGRDSRDYSGAAGVTKDDLVFSLLRPHVVDGVGVFFEGFDKPIIHHLEQGIHFISANGKFIVRKGWRIEVR